MVSLNEIDLRPPYQRDIKWSKENMCDFIHTVFTYGLVPQILLYKLQADEVGPEGKKWECIDGQHRLYVLSLFYAGKPHFPLKGKPFLVSLNYEAADGQTAHIFYKKTDQTEAWREEHRSVSTDYMTKEERDRFDTYLLDLKKITSPLTKDQRRQQFNKLQKGVPVKGSDFYKNKTDVPLVKYISDHKNWEEPMKKRLREHCTNPAQQYWLNWLIRCYLLQRSPSVESFMVSDKAIEGMMKAKKSELNTTLGEQNAFGPVVERFFAFLDLLPATVKFTPTHFYVVFVSLLDVSPEREKVLKSHMSDWAKEYVEKKHRKMWEGRNFDPAERKDYYEDRLRSLESIVSEAFPVPARKAVPKKIKNAVWYRWAGEKLIGKCFCCKEEINQSNFHCAHILAWKMGGNNTESNLRPTCSSCNQSMGTENMRSWMARNGMLWSE
jgi:Protein of unknown function DUF262/HNH endonuclease